MTNQASEAELRYVLRHTKVTAYAAGKPYVVNLATVIQKEDIDAILAIIRTEKLKLLAEVREQTTIFKIKAHDKKGQPHLYEAGRGVPTEVVDKLEAEL